MRYIFASNNKGKISELKASLNIDILTLEEVGFTEDIEEFGVTFEQNALIKAQAISKLFPGDIIISDDSGIEVEALDFAPGVYSKRFSGATENVDAENNKLMLAKLSGALNRNARFRTVLCVYSQAHNLCHFFNGVVNGQILTAPEGENGFGYDPIFSYEGISFANLSKEQKNQVSHRGRAIAKLIDSGILNV